MQFDIAIANTRTAKIWKNKKITWEQFTAKLSVPRHTAETMAEYAAMGKDRQAEVKDVGGFVGGYLNEGRRKPGFVRHRQLLTLDADFADADFWETFTFLYDCAALIYSTHKHTAQLPRLRLVIPLDRPVSSEEYEAIGRKIAAAVGMHRFDRTGFQPYRLMYWQSTSKDGEYVFESQEGYPLNTDRILASYVNWKDVSEWPLCENENDLARQSVSEMQMPTLKAGLIGAFCRAYSITQAMDEFIPEKYISVGNDRYTFSGSTASGGAIVYEDLFLYSHHNTDPVGGTSVNAFDMVRIHRFGHLDRDTDTEVTRRASYAEMVNLAQRDPEVVREIGSFAVDFEDTEWMKALDASAKGVLKETIHNVRTILENDENLKGGFAFNAFEGRRYVMRPLPWNGMGKPRPFEDEDDAGLRGYLEKTYGIFQLTKTQDAIDVVSRINSFHPIRDYLNTLSWDGKPRIERLLIKCFGADNNAYVRAVTRISLVAAVARVMQPGIKWDHVPILISPQGFGKSKFLAHLGGEWFSDTLDSVAGKDAYEQIQGSWLIELGELASLNKAESEQVKHFITKTKDRYRKAYGRHVAEVARQQVFWGSSNKWAILRDPTGARRFWPVVLKNKFRGGLERDQIWAEALYYYAQGEDLYLGEEMEAMANEIQARHTDRDDRWGAIEKYLDTKIFMPELWNRMSRFERKSFLAGEAFETDNGKRKELIERSYVCAAEIWVEAIGAEFKDMNQHNTKFIHDILQSMGWKPTGTRKFAPYGPQRGYQRPVEIEKLVNILDFLD